MNEHKKDTVLIIGSGGREHALAWKLAQSNHVGRVLVASGNAGTEDEPNVENIICEPVLEAWTKIAREENADLVVIGPELPLVFGLADELIKNDIAVFGPTKFAAQLEGSKAFAKDFMHKYGIPTAQYQVFDNEEAALSWLDDNDGAWVVKADGLAAGKGVILCDTTDEAREAVRDIFAGKFGEAGSRIVIEEYLKGEEASYICIVAGNDIVPMASSQDHKARDNGDLGPNTGGMGAYSPAPIVDEDMERKILDLVIKPVIKGLESEGANYIGFLYAGIMVGEDGIPKVLEFNCRMGDPETQPILMRLESDLYPVLKAAADGESLKDTQLSWDARVALGVVMAAGGYPEEYVQGNEITGIHTEFGHGIKVFHAGTAYQNNYVVTAGGRVLCVTALGRDVATAQQLAYDAVKEIYWDGVYYRTDIGHRAVNR